MTKNEIRNAAKQLRANILQSKRELLNMQIFERAHKHPAFQLAQRIHVYCSSPSEVETMPFIEYAWATGKQVYVPIIASDQTMMHALIVETTSWRMGPFDIREPADSTQRIQSTEFSSTDCIIVPVVAFDRRCHRIGHGGGYYDRFLAETKAPRIGIAYECQRIPSIPTEAHDIQLNGIATEERWYAP